LGTAGGIVYAAERLPDEASIVVVANGDSVAFGDLAAARAKLVDPTIEGVLCAVDVPDAGSFGSLAVDAEGVLRDFREKRPGRGLVNAGVYLLRRATIDRLRKLGVASLENEAFPQLLADGARFAVHALAGPLLDIGTPERLASAEHYLLHEVEHEAAGRRAA
jgi:NDP-sugar pyrophosphorylase family protein